MNRNTKTQLKYLKQGDRFLKFGVASKEVYKLIEIDGLNFMCIKCSILDLKSKSYNPLIDSKKINSETNVIFLRNEK